MLVSKKVGQKIISAENNLTEIYPSLQTRGKEIFPIKKDAPG